MNSLSNHFKPNYSLTSLFRPKSIFSLYDPRLINIQKKTFSYSPVHPSKPIRKSEKWSKFRIILALAVPYIILNTHFYITIRDSKSKELDEEKKQTMDELEELGSD